MSSDLERLSDILESARKIESRVARGRLRFDVLEHKVRASAEYAGDDRRTRYGCETSRCDCEEKAGKRCSTEENALDGVRASPKEDLVQRGKLERVERARLQSE